MDPQACLRLIENDIIEILITSYAKRDEDVRALARGAHHLLKGLSTGALTWRDEAEGVPVGAALVRAVVNIPDEHHDETAVSLKQNLMNLFNWIDTGGFEPDWTWYVKGTAVC